MRSGHGFFPAEAGRTLGPIVRRVKPKLKASTKYLSHFFSFVA